MKSVIYGAESASIYSHLRGASQARKSRVRNAERTPRKRTSQIVLPMLTSWSEGRKNNDRAHADNSDSRIHDSHLRRRAVWAEPLQ